MHNLIHPDTKKELIKLIEKLVKIIKKEICGDKQK